MLDIARPARHGPTSSPLHPVAVRLAWPRQALSPAAPVAEDALPAAAAAASARLAMPPWELHRQAMAAGPGPNPGRAAETLEVPAHPEHAEALRRCTRFQQRLAAAGDEQLLRAWLHPRDVARFMGAGGGAEAAAQRQELLLEVSG